MIVGPVHLHPRLASAGQLAKQALMLDGFGVDCFYVTDSAGYLTSDWRGEPISA